MLKVSCDELGLMKAAQEVNAGRTIVFPTDTVYGVGCNPYDGQAVRRVCDLKGRIDKPMPVLCSGLSEASALVELGPFELSLAKKFWPGPLTIVTPLRDKRIPTLLTAGSDMVGIRVPNHSCALKLIQLCGGKLVGTSANRSGMRPPRNPAEVSQVFDVPFDVLVDGGETPLGAESTVISVMKGKVRILREGCLKSSYLAGFV